MNEDLKGYLFAFGVFGPVALAAVWAYVKWVPKP
jgi:hypothetical protein